MTRLAILTTMARPLLDRQACPLVGAHFTPALFLCISLSLSLETSLPTPPRGRGSHAMDLFTSSYIIIKGARVFSILVQARQPSLLTGPRGARVSAVCSGTRVHERLPSVQTRVPAQQTLVL